VLTLPLYYNNTFQNGRARQKAHVVVIHTQIVTLVCLSLQLENTQANGSYGPWMNKFCWNKSLTIGA
jgi:hypothetical protein